MEQNNDHKFKRFLCSKLGKVAMILIMYIIVLLIVMAIINTEADIILVPLILILAVSGWKALTKITPNIFLIMPIGGWLIYFLVKGVLSIAIGPFVFPFVVAKKIAESVQRSISGE